MVHLGTTAFISNEELVSFLSQLNTEELSGLEDAFEGFFCLIDEYFGDRASFVKTKIIRAAANSLDD